MSASSADLREPFAPPPGSGRRPLACLTCPPHNVAMRMTRVHPARSGVVVHLVCSQGHAQRLVVRSAEGRVLIEAAPSTRSISPRRGEIIH